MTTLIAGKTLAAWKELVEERETAAVEAFVERGAKGPVIEVDLSGIPSEVQIALKHWDPVKEREAEHRAERASAEAQRNAEFAANKRAEEAALTPEQRRIKRLEAARRRKIRKIEQREAARALSLRAKNMRKIGARR